MTSNREHDDSVVRIFTCFCGEGCESSSKNCQPGALQGGCSNSTNLQEVLRFMSYRFYDRLEAKKVTGRFRESEVCKVRERAVLEFVDLFYAFQTKRFCSTPAFLGRGRDFTDSVA